MKLFSLSTIEQFSPGDQEFLLTSVKLLKEELLIFKSKLNEYPDLNNLPNLKNAIHRIKSNMELFLFDNDFQEVLFYIYELGEDTLKSVLSEGQASLTLNALSPPLFREAT